MSTKPVLFPDQRSDAERFDPMLHRGHLDPSRIRGYSEVVQANDIDKADDLIFREKNLGRTKEDIYVQLGARPADLPIRIAWLPITGVDGGMSSHVARQLDQYTNQQGFRPVTWTMDEDGHINVPVLDEYGYTLDGPSRYAEDGTIRRGPDVALYWCDGEVARKWDAYKLDRVLELQGKKLDGFTAGGYDAPPLNPEDVHEEVIVKH